MSKRDVVNLNYTIWIDPNSDSDVDSTNLSTIQVLFMTRSVDVFFSDEEFLKLMGGTDYLVDLRDYLPQELLDRYEDQQIKVLNTMTGETIVAGIWLEDNAWVQKTGWYEHTAAVGLADGMKNPELAAALRWNTSKARRCPALRASTRSNFHGQDRPCQPQGRLCPAKNPKLSRGHSMEKSPTESRKGVKGQLPLAESRGSASGRVWGKAPSPHFIMR